MRAYLLSLALLAVVAFSLATALEPWFQNWAGNRTRSNNVLQVALGDSRRLFAKHFYLKADAYFHNGYYPTIYDSTEGFAQAHVGGAAHGQGGEAEEAEDFLGKPRDWIDRLGRNFYPAQHTTSPAPAVVIENFECFKVKKHGPVKVASCKVAIQGDTLRINKTGGADLIRWRTRAADAASNVGGKTCEVSIAKEEDDD